MYKNSKYWILNDKIDNLDVKMNFDIYIDIGDFR